MSPSPSDRPLEAAAEALADHVGGWRYLRTGEVKVAEAREVEARVVVAAYLDALVEELPEEAVDAAWDAIGEDVMLRDAIRAFLSALKEGKS